MVQNVEAFLSNNYVYISMSENTLDDEPRVDLFLHVDGGIASPASAADCLALLKRKLVKKIDDVEKVAVAVHGVYETKANDGLLPFDHTIFLKSPMLPMELEILFEDARNMRENVLQSFLEGLSFAEGFDPGFVETVTPRMIIIHYA